LIHLLQDDGLFMDNGVIHEVVIVSLRNCDSAEECEYGYAADG
jgi:hypothetical protein